MPITKRAIEGEKSKLKRGISQQDWATLKKAIQEVREASAPFRGRDDGEDLGDSGEGG